MRELGAGIVTSNRPPKHAMCFSCDAHAMEESRGSREALYFQGIFGDASVNDPRVRGDRADVKKAAEPMLAMAITLQCAKCVDLLVARGLPSLI